MIVPKIKKAKPIPTAPASDSELHVLVSKKDFDQLLWALYSFFIHSQKLVSLVVHDDGTLGQTDSEIISHLFPSARFIKRADADAWMNEKLAEFPRCQKFRRGHVTNLKVLDFWVLSNAQKIIYFDSDLVFFDNPGVIFNEGNFFLRDIWTNYCISYERLTALFGIEIRSHVNIGFGSIDRSVFSLSAVEELLSHPEIKDAPYIADQTILAILSSRRGLMLLDGKYQMLNNPPLSNRVINHYTNVIRHKMYTEAIPLLFNRFVK